LKSIGATAPGRLKLQRQLKSEIEALGFSEAFDKYRMCDPRASPEKSISEHMEPGEFSVSYAAVCFCISYLKMIGAVVNMKEPVIDVIKHSDMTTSAGFGFTQLAKSKVSLLLSWLADRFCYDRYKDWYDRLPSGIFPLSSIDPQEIEPDFITNLKVKEEVSKAEKVAAGDHRTFFVTPFKLIMESKCEQEALNEKLSEKGFMFKGVDTRSLIRDLYYACMVPGVFAKQGDAKKLDRSISRTLLKQCFDVRKALGARSSKGVMDATLYPVVHYVDSKGVSQLAKIEKPQLSGRDSTTEDDLLCIFLVVCQYCVDNGLSIKDIAFTGVGDDWTLRSHDSFNGLTPEYFAQYGINMKVWDVKDKFHFLGADMFSTWHGMQPAWDLERSMVRLAYRQKPSKESDAEYLSRVLNVYAFNYFNPMVSKLGDFFKKCLRSMRVNSEDLIQLRSQYLHAGDFYVRSERVGSNLSMTKTKSQKARAKAQANAGKAKVEITVNPKKAGSLKERKPMKFVSKWLRSVMDPWNHPPEGVPDEDCAPSVKYTSRFTQAFYTDDTSTTPGVNHGILIGVAPYVNQTTAIAGAGAIATRSWKESAGRYSGNVNVYTMPNQASMFPLVQQGTANSTQSYSHRPTAMSATLFYAGAELNRSGRIVAGLIEPMALAVSTTANTQSYNPLNAAFGYAIATQPDIGVSEVKNRMRRLTTVRNPDGSVTVTWIPTGVPKYEPLVTASSSYVDQIFAHFGPVIVFAVDGDITSSASALGNVFQLDVVMHFEVQPLSRYALVIPPTPSPYDPLALAEALNHFQSMSSVTEEDVGGKHALADGRQSNVGSAWETIRRNIPNPENVLSGAQAVVSNPFFQHAVRYMSQRQRARQQYLTN